LCCIYFRNYCPHVSHRFSLLLAPNNKSDVTRASDSGGRAPRKWRANTTLSQDEPSMT
jgi:hypothetical protein